MEATEATEAPATLWQAIHAVQAEATTLQKSSLNPHFGSKFVPLDALHEAIFPLINGHGLVWVCKPSTLYDDGKLVAALHYKLVHAATGESEEGVMPLCEVKHDPQGQGSGITYARRYALMAVLGLVADEDDDGNGASHSAASSRGKQAGKATTRGKATNGRSGAAKAPSEAEKATTPQMTQVGELYSQSGLGPEGLRVIIEESGARGSKNLTSDQAVWVIAKLQELVEEKAKAAA